MAHSIPEENETPKDSNDIVDQKDQDESSQLETKTQRKLTLSDKYDIKERPRIDRIKSDLNLNFWKVTEYERKQSISEPSAFKKSCEINNR